MSKKMDPPTPDRNRPLPSKLMPPRLPKIVPRARLFRELDHARTRPIIWIAAPPGAGKTTLVASYLHARRLRPLWYTVDERDGDLATFFHYLSLAAGPLAARKSPPLPHLTTEYLQGLSVFTRNVFEALDAHLPRSVALVLDNYQTIPADSPVHEMLALGLSHLTVERPVLIISREEPPPAWASLLASRRMTRLDGHTLRLTSAETRAIIALYRSRRRNASAEKALAQAVATLDGWMAGLVLLLEEATGPSTTLASHEQSRQAMFNFLGAEVFARMDVSTQDVLRSTAYCPVVTGAMATELSGHRDAESCLETLYRRRYFVERHEGTPASYTYHPLLQEFLRHRLPQDWPTERLLALRTKTAHLLATVGQVEAAVDLSIDAQDHESVAYAIISHAPSLLRQGRFAPIQRWLQALPTDRRANDPWLVYWSAPAPPRRSMRPRLSRFEHSTRRPIACLKPTAS
jgi:ATP/maltotriose-dependent transcriptional regulator MalT